MDSDGLNWATMAQMGQQLIEFGSDDSNLAVMARMGQLWIELDTDS